MRVCSCLTWAALPGVSESSGMSEPGATSAVSDTRPNRRRWSRHSVPERLERMELRYRGRTRSAIQPGQRPEPSVPAGTDLIPQIKHIVVLMMENHSYDNYLGMLSGRGEGFPLDDDGAPAVTNLDAEGSPVRAHHLATTKQADGRALPELAREPGAVEPGQDGRLRHQHAGSRAGRGPGGGHGLLVRGGPAVLLRSGADLPRGRSAGSARAWDRPSPTAGSSSPARPTAWSTTCRSICSTTRRTGPSSTC